MSTLKSKFQTYGIFFAWVVALFATFGSLFLSEVMLFEPCKLCWIQRIFMYPLAIILGIAALNNDSGVIRYAIPLSMTGGVIALYHYLEQQIPALQSVLPCRVGVPCHLDYLDWFGWITIPLLALIAFILITVFLFAARESEKEQRLEDMA